MGRVILFAALAWLFTRLRLWPWLWLLALAVLAGAALGSHRAAAAHRRRATVQSRR